MQWIYDDGGRAAAGFHGTARDCVCRAIAIATGQPYQEVYSELNRRGKTEPIGRRKQGKSNARSGIYTYTERNYLASLGWKWMPTMRIGQGCRIHLNAAELPRGRLIMSLSRHLTAVIDGVIHDIYDPSRNKTRCVYGYYCTERTPCPTA